VETFFVGDWGCLIHGEALASLRELPDESVDALVTDPPGGIAFMNREWDKDKGGRNAWVAWFTEIMAEVYRVLKPGAHGVVWSIPRTSHWTAWALENAGFEIADNFAVLQIFGQGFPKSRNISQDIDRMAGAEREVVGPKPWKNQDIRGGRAVGGGGHEQLMETAPSTEEAKRYEGFGTALKPAYEPWILVRKPIKERNIARNVLTHGTGAMNLGACEVGRDPGDVPGWHKSGANGANGFQGEDTFRIRAMNAAEIKDRRGDKGRHPPNLVLLHTEHCVQVGVRKVKGCPATVIQGGKDGGGYDVGSGDGTRRGVFQGYGDADGMETCELWACVPGCPVREIDSQSGSSRSAGGKGKASRKKSGSETIGWEKPETWTGAGGYGDVGGASRYFPCFKYQPKPSRSEKEAGLDQLEAATLNRVNSGGLENEERWKPVQVKNNHPTVKSIDFARWLIRLVNPPGGLVLDPFLGSGSIGCAAALEGARFLGIEQGDPPGCDRYLRIAEARMRYWREQAEKGLK